MTYDDKSRGKGGKEKISLKGGKFGFNLKIILLFFLFGVNINNTFSKVCQVSNNKTNHMINGNISKKGTLTLLTWNKGNSTFKTKGMTY